MPTTKQPTIRHVAGTVETELRGTRRVKRQRCLRCDKVVAALDNFYALGEAVAETSGLFEPAAMIDIRRERRPLHDCEADPI